MADKTKEQVNPFKLIYNDLGYEKEGVKYNDFLDTFKSNPDARKAVYKDLGYEKEGIKFDDFENTLGFKKTITPQAPKGFGMGETTYADIPVEERAKMTKQTSSPKSSKKTKTPKSTYDVSNPFGTFDYDKAVEDFKVSKATGQPKNTSINNVQDALSNQLAMASQAYALNNPDFNPNNVSSGKDEISGGDEGRDWFRKFEDFTGLSTAYGGMSSAIYKPLAGASRIINDGVNYVYKAVSGKDLYKDGEDRRGIWGSLADEGEERARLVEEQRKGNGTILGDVYHGTVATAPLIMATTMTGGTASMASRVGAIAGGEAVSLTATQAPQVISHLTKFLSTTGALKGYDQAKLDGKDTKEALRETAKGGFHGAVEGLTIEAQMMVGKALGKQVVGELVSKGLFKGGKATQATMEALGVGTAFAGTSVGQNIANGEEIDWRNAGVQFGMGLAFEIPNITKGVGSEVADYKSKSKINSIILENMGERNQENKVSSFINATPEMISGIYQMEKTPEQLLVNSIEQGVKAGESKDLKEKQAGHLAQIGLQNASNIKEITSDIVRNPKEFIDGINASDLPPEFKQQIIGKVSEVYKTFNPVERKKAEFGVKIKEVDSQIADFTEKSKATTDPVEKAEYEVQVEYLTEERKKLDGTLKMQIREQLNRKPEPRKVEELTPEDVVEIGKEPEKEPTELSDSEIEAEIKKLEEENAKLDAKLSPDPMYSTESLSKKTDKELDEMATSGLPRDGGNYELSYERKRSVEAEFKRRYTDDVMKSEPAEGLKALDELEKKERVVISKKDGVGLREVLTKYSEADKLEQKDVEKDFKSSLLDSAKSAVNIKSPYTYEARLLRSIAELTKRGVDANSLKEMAVAEFKKFGYKESEYQPKIEEILNPKLNELNSENTLDKMNPELGAEVIGRAKDYMSKVAPILAKLFPDIKVDFYPSTAEYTAKTGRPELSAGVFDRSNKTIGFNMELISKRGAERTIYHEAMHPFVDALYYKDPKSLSEAVKKINELAKEVDISELSEHVENYRDRDGETQSIEYVTEFLAKTLDGTIDYSKMEKSKFTKIKEVVNKLLETIGIQYRLTTASDLKVLAEQVGKAVETGETSSLESSVGKKNLDLSSKYEGKLDALTPEGQDRLKKLREELNARAKAKLSDQKERLETRSKNKLAEQKEKSLTKEDAIKAKFEDKIADQKQRSDIDKESTVASLKDKHASEIEKVTNKFLAKISDIKGRAEDKANTIKDLMKEFQSEIKAEIEKASKSGVLKGEVNASKVKNLLNRLNNADTPTKLMDASDYVYEALKGIEHDNNLKQTKSLLNKIKTISNSKSMPANVAGALKRLAGVQITARTEDVVGLNRELARVVESYKGEISNGLSIQKINDITKKLVEAKEKRLSDKYRAIISANTDFDIPKNATFKDLQILMEKISEPSESNDSGRDIQEAVYEAIKVDLDVIDASTLSPRKQEALEALKNIDVSRIDDAVMSKLILSTKNAIENGDYSGVSEVLNAHRLNESLADDVMNKKAKEATRIVSKVGQKFRSNWGSVTAQINAVTRDKFLLPHLSAVVGAGKLRDSYAKYKNRIDAELVKPLDKILDKYKKDILDNKNQVLLSMYADLNNFRTSWTDLQKAEEFDGRKKAIKRSIELMEKRATFDADFAKDNKEYIATLNDAYETIKDFESPADIAYLLNTGSKKLYAEARKFYDANKEAMRENAELDNNIEFEGDWAHYFPRMYERMIGSSEKDMTQIESIEQASGSSMFANRISTSEQSGSQKGRLIKGAQLPEGKSINFRFVDTYIQSAKDMLYDIETQADRKYAGYALNNSKIYEVFSDKSGVDVMKSAMVQNVNNQRNGVMVGAERSAGQKFISSYQTLAVRMALGGLFQAPKQAVSAIVETSVNLGHNSYLMGSALNTLFANKEASQLLMSNFAISRRGVENNFSNKVDVRSKELTDFKKKLKSSFLTSGVRLADDVIDKMALGSLKAGDDLGAKMSWLAYYMEFQKKADPSAKFDIVKESKSPDMKASDYAEHMTSLTLNINDGSLKPKQSITSILAPFASFNINAKVNLLSNVRRLGQIRDHNLPEAKQLIKLITANLGSMVSMNMMGMGIRYMMIGGASALVANAISSGDDLDEKQKEKALALIEKTKEEQINNNVSNSLEYMAKDLIYGGIAGAVTDPIYDQAKGTLFELMDWEKPKSFKADGGIESSLGLFSIPIRTAQKVYKNFDGWSQTDETFRQNRFGIEDAYGERIIVPDEHSEDKRSETIKGIYGLATISSIVQMTGLSSQEVSALMSRSVSLGKKIENELSSKQNKATLDDLKNLKFITIKGKRIELTDEQYEFRITERRKYLDRFYNKFLLLHKNARGKKFDRTDFESRMKAKANKSASMKLAFKYEELRGMTILKERMEEEAEKEAKEEQ